MFGVDKHPFYWLLVDFSSILFALNIDPESYYPMDKNNFFKQIKIDVTNFTLHNVLDDAKLLRGVCLKMIK